MTIANSSIYFCNESGAQEKSGSMQSFRKYLYAEEFKTAFTIAEKELNFDKIYLLVVKNDQRVYTFPNNNSIFEGKKQIFAPEFYSQLAEQGFIYINRNNADSADLINIMDSCNTNEFYLYPIYSSFQALTFLCCARKDCVHISGGKWLDVENINSMALLIGDTIDRIYYKFETQKSFA